MKFGLKLVILICVAISAGCSSAPPPPANGANSNAAEERRSGRAVRDDLGKIIVLPDEVKRAVSLAPNLTEIIFAVGAGNRLVGVTSFCDYPAETKSIQKIGDTLKPNIESIIALKPDVVFVTTASQLETFTDTLKERNIAVIVTNPDSLEGIFKSIELVGVVFKSPEAGNVIANLRKRVETVEGQTADAAKPTVFVQLDRSLFTIGRDSYLTDLVARAGGVSATANVEKAYAQLSKEAALALDPEVIILSESSDNTDAAEVFSGSRAVKSGRVVKINADLLSRPGPRIVDGLEKLAAAIHPEVFKK